MTSRVRRESEVPTVEATSRPVRVTLFEDRALVVRRAVARVPEGRSTVVVDGLTPLVDDPSLGVVAVTPGVGVLVARVRRRVVRRARAEGAALEALREEARAAAGRRAAADLGLERARAEEQRIQAVLGAWHGAVARVPRVAVEGVATWRDAYRELEGALQAALEAQDQHARASVAAHREEGEARARLAQGEAVQPRHEAAVEVQVEASEGGRVELEVAYRTPCALWRPEHVARLSRVRAGEGASGPAGANAGSGMLTSPASVPPGASGMLSGAGGKGFALEIATLATAWQATGEVWEGVEVHLSTARPAQAAAPPRLEDDVLVLRAKSEAERQAVVVEARDQSVAVAGLDRGARAVDEMPGVEDGGEPVSLQVRAPATLVSDGQPVRLEVGRVEMPCEVDRVAWPERSEAVFVRATATWTGRVPLLAGPVRLVGGDALVGRARARFVAPGEPFEMGFGIDDSLRVRRQVAESRDTAMLVGTQRITRKVWVGVSNMGGEARQLEVVERIPVSEIGAVKVVVVSLGGARLDEADGFAHFALAVPPNSTRSVELEYRIEAGPKVTLPF